MMEQDSRQDPAAEGEAFMRLFTLHHRRVFGFIMTMLPDRGDAEEVFQETSAVMWRAFGTFEAGGDFVKWANGVAFNQVRKFRRQKRRGAVGLSDEMLEALAADRQEMTAELDERRTLLEACVNKLRAGDRRLIELYYGTKTTADEVAATLGCSVHTVYKGLQRVRRMLMDCVEKSAG